MKIPLCSAQRPEACVLWGSLAVAGVCQSAPFPLEMFVVGEGAPWHVSSGVGVVVSV